MIQVTGLAAGRRSTKEAAPGALCIRDYKDRAEALRHQDDWRHVIGVIEKPDEKTRKARP